MSVFIDYQKVNFSESSNGDNVIYTTAYKCMVQILVTSEVEWDGFESIRIYATPSNLVDNEINLWEASNTDNNADVNSAVLASGTDIRAFRNNESVAGEIHVFRLPEI